MKITSTEFKKVSIEELTTPKEGYVVMKNRWWQTTDDGFVLFYTFGENGITPQCNTNKFIVEKTSEREIYKKLGCKPKLIETAFVPPSVFYDI